ncbi:MAG: MATE family efflux transporter [Phycisphaerae bacterium]|nr:MATE family efflux transporter [Phycisphaerae bacterium]
MSQQIAPELPVSDVTPWPTVLWRIVCLSAPIVPAMLAQMFIGFADAWMAGKIGVGQVSFFGYSIPLDTRIEPGAGEAALAAVTPSAMVCWTIMSIFIGTAGAVTTFASQALGRGDLREAGRYAWQGIYLSAGTLGVAVLSVMLSPWFFGKFTHDPLVLANEIAYFNVRIWSLPIAVLVSVLSGFFNGVHRPARPAIVGIASNVFNLAFCWLLVYGRAGFPRLGIAGSAWASVAASALGMLVMIAFFFQPQFVRVFGTISGWPLSIARLGRLLRIGLPSAASWLMDMIGWTLLVVVLIQPLGRTEAAASNAAFNYLQIGFMPVVGVAIALSALVGKSIGQRRLRDARRFAVGAFLIAGAYQLLIGVGMIVFRAALMRFFSDNPEVIAVGSRVLICAGIFQVFDAMGIIYTHALRGAGDTLFMLLAYVLLNFLFFVPAGLLGTWVIAKRYYPSAQPIAPWIAGTLYVIGLGLVCWRRWQRGRWERMDIFGNTTAAATP